MGTATLGQSTANGTEVGHKQGGSAAGAHGNGGSGLGRRGSGKGRQCWCRARLLVVHGTWAQVLLAARSGGRGRKWRLKRGGGGGFRKCE